MNHRLPHKSPDPASPPPCAGRTDRAGAILKCVECNRPLLRFAASMRVRGNLVGWGPKCALIAGQVKKHSRPSVRRDRRTVDWVEASA